MVICSLYSLGSVVNGYSDDVTETPSVPPSPSLIRVNIYALRDNITNSVANVEVPKSFVHRNDLLPRLRTNIFGETLQTLVHSAAHQGDA